MGKTAKILIASAGFIVLASAIAWVPALLGAGILAAAGGSGPDFLAEMQFEAGDADISALLAERYPPGSDLAETLADLEAHGFRIYENGDILAQWGGLPCLHIAEIDVVSDADALSSIRGAVHTGCA